MANCRLASYSFAYGRKLQHTIKERRFMMLQETLSLNWKAKTNEWRTNCWKKQYSPSILLKFWKRSPQKCFGTAWKMQTKLNRKLGAVLQDKFCLRPDRISLERVTTFPAGICFELLKGTAPRPVNCDGRTDCLVSQHNQKMLQMFRSCEGETIMTHSRSLNITGPTTAHW